MKEIIFEIVAEEIQQKNQLVTRWLSQGSFQKDTERDKKIEKNE